MIKKKISTRLTLYFASALLIFAIIIGSIFVLLFRNQSLVAYKAKLENQSTQIADTFSSYLSERGNSMGGLGMYLNLVNDVTDADVWIVDQNLNLISTDRGHHHSQSSYQYNELPKDAEKLIDQAFFGERVFSEDFSGFLAEPTLSVGTPIVNQSNKVIGVVLLHAPIQGVNQAISQGIIILVLSILLALLVSFILSIILSRSFTKPLYTMKNTALKLIDGDYLVKTHITQDDEIGELAQTLDVLAKRLDVASQKSEKLEKMRQDFVANISHELKTPITVIRGSLEALIDEVVTDPNMVQEYHHQMLHESKFLQRLVGDLLDLSKLQSMEFAIEKQEISMHVLVDDVIRSVKPIADQSHITISLNKSDQDSTIMGDYGRLRQMIMIVMDNAIKYSTPNQTVEITLDEHQLSIFNQGKGIKLEDQPYVFERFYRSPSEENKTGTGLGLAIAKQIAQRHDITLTLTSVENEGTTFIFHF